MGYRALNFEYVRIPLGFLKFFLFQKLSNIVRFENSKTVKYFDYYVLLSTLIYTDVQYCTTSLKFCMKTFFTASKSCCFFFKYLTLKNECIYFYCGFFMVGLNNLLYNAVSFAFSQDSYTSIIKKKAADYRIE